MAPDAWAELLRRPAAERHIVQLYRDRGFLARAVATWIGGPLASGGGAALACSPLSLADVLARLEADGVDAQRAIREGRIVALDAEDFLGRFMRDGEPRPHLFKPVLRDACARLRARCAPGSEVHAWGEMVDILVKRGEAPAAQRLEALWNQVVDEEGIRLLCSYELDHLAPDAHTGRLEAVSAGHSHLFAEEDAAGFEAALDAALVAVYGEGEAARLRARLGAARALPVGMSPAQAALVALQRRDAAGGARVLAHLRAAIVRAA